LNKYTFAGGVYFRRMYDSGLYTTDVRRINQRVKAAGMDGVFNRKLVQDKHRTGWLPT